MAKLFFGQPLSAQSLGELLKNNLTSGNWTEFRAAVAFLKFSGMQHLSEPLQYFLKNPNSKSKVSVGVDLFGTSVEGLRELLAASGIQGEVWVFHDNAGHHPTFHPKLYFFKNSQAALVLIGSGNITQGGLFTNYEAEIVIDLDLSTADDVQLLQQIETALDYWCDPSTGLSALLDKKGFVDLINDGLITLESATPNPVPAPPTKSATKGKKVPPSSLVFAKSKFPTIPNPGKTLTTKSKPPRKIPASRVPPTSKPKVAPVASQIGSRFLMTLQKTDVGIGQTHAGASRRSPEIFIPLAARNHNTSFWGWDSMFVEDTNKPGKFDRQGVKMRIGSSIVAVNMMTWPDKSDFRLRSEALRSAGNIGDILQIQATPTHPDYDYDVKIISSGTKRHSLLSKRCNEPVRNSKKQWGYY